MPGCRPWGSRCVQPPSLPARLGTRLGLRSWVGGRVQPRVPGCSGAPTPPRAEALTASLSLGSSVSVGQALQPPGDSDGEATPELGGDRRPLTCTHGLSGCENCRRTPRLVPGRATVTRALRNCPSCCKRIAALVQWAPLLPPTPPCMGGTPPAPNPALHGGLPSCPQLRPAWGSPLLPSTPPAPQARLPWHCAPLLPCIPPSRAEGGELGVQYGGVSLSHLISEKAAPGLPPRSAPGKACSPSRALTLGTGISPLQPSCAPLWLRSL